MQHGVALLAACAIGMVPLSVRADGAFPDALQLFLPPDRPGVILLATNFGLVVTEDGGATWDLICESEIAFGAFLYQMGPAPSYRLYAVGLNIAVVESSSTACDFEPAAFPNDVRYGSDVFADPTDAMHVLALDLPVADRDLSHLFESHDGGITFDATFTATAGRRLTGVEIARSDPSKWYLTTTTPDPVMPALLRSRDGGRTFELIDWTLQLGPKTPRLAAVDPEDPQRLYLRVTGGGPGDALALSEDGGDTVSIRLEARQPLTALLRRADGTFW